VRDKSTALHNMPAYTGAERRRFPRVNVQGVSTYINVLSTTLPFPVINLSAGGAFVQVTEPMPIGVLMGLQLFRVGTPLAFFVRARVVWAASAKAAMKKACLPGVRLRFEPMLPDAANSLQKLLAEFGVEEESRNPEVAKEHTHPSFQKTEIIEEIEPIVLGEEVSVMEFEPGEEEEKTGTISIAVPMPERAQPLPLTLPLSTHAASTADARLLGRISRLTEQLQEFQKLVERQDRELINLRQRLSLREEELVKAEKGRRAAELAVRRLSMQLAAFRR